MPQGTVKHFDTETYTGAVLLDTQEELPLDASTFWASGLRELRIGQRVRLELSGEGADKRVTKVDLVSF